MRKEKNIFATPARPWQLRWWQENSERWRWAGTIAIAVMLIGAFAYQNPDIWNPAPVELAEQGGAPQIAQSEAPAVINDIAPEIPEPPEDEKDAGAAPAAVALPSETEAEDTEPQGMQELEASTLKDEVVAVSAPPASWLQPAFGVWARVYGYALDPTYGDYRFHHGRDMELDAGAAVFAVAAGRVLLAAEDPVWGGVVVVEHGGGWRSVYKCVKPQVQPGAELAAGDQLGVALAFVPAELAQATHVHFELELDGKSQNPEQWL